MYDFSVSLICVGFDDGLIESLKQEDICVSRKGDIWRKRTGQKYQDNIVRLTLPATHDGGGYGGALDCLIAKIKNEEILLNLVSKCRVVEVQFSASIDFSDDSQSMPWLHLSTQQLLFLTKINAEVDIHISY